MTTNGENVGGGDGSEPIVIQVNDKRRVSADADLPDAGTAETSEDPAGTAETPDAASERVSLLEERLRDAEERAGEAERQMRDLAERFRSAQSQLRVEADEQRQRLQRNFDQRLDAARGEILVGFLETLDNLRRAVAAAEGTGNREAGLQSLLGGVRATVQIFEARMQSFGLTAVPAVGEEFNPELHEAVEIVAVSPEQDNKVIEEYQTGYKLGERLLRPARVRVGRGR